MDAGNTRSLIGQLMDGELERRIGEAYPFCPDDKCRVCPERCHNLVNIARDEVLKARLVELDLLEQAINGGWDMYRFKIARLENLTERREKLSKEDV